MESCFQPVLANRYFQLLSNFRLLNVGKILTNYKKKTFFNMFRIVNKDSKENTKMCVFPATNTLFSNPYFQTFVDQIQFQG